MPSLRPNDQRLLVISATMGDVELVILCGLQASGKSTFRRERFPWHVVVSKDLLRNNRRRDRRQRQLVAEALSAGESVVVDNTNPGPEDRAALVEIGRRLGARVIGFYFEARFEVSVERNADRSGGELVPLVGLVDVARRLRVPRAEEGFDELWIVRTTSGKFEVEPMFGDEPWLTKRARAGRRSDSGEPGLGEVEVLVDRDGGHPLPEHGLHLRR